MSNFVCWVDKMDPAGNRYWLRWLATDVESAEDAADLVIENLSSVEQLAEGAGLWHVMSVEVFPADSLQTFQTQRINQPLYVRRK